MKLDEIKDAQTFVMKMRTRTVTLAGSDYTVSKKGNVRRILGRVVNVMDLAACKSWPEVKPHDGSLICNETYATEAVGPEIHEAVRADHREQRIMKGLYHSIENPGVLVDAATGGIKLKS